MNSANVSLKWVSCVHHLMLLPSPERHITQAKHIFVHILQSNKSCIIIAECLLPPLLARARSLPFSLATFVYFSVHWTSQQLSNDIMINENMFSCKTISFLRYGHGPPIKLTRKQIAKWEVKKKTVFKTLAAREAPMAPVRLHGNRIAVFTQ